MEQSLQLVQASCYSSPSLHQPSTHVLLLNNCSVLKPPLCSTDEVGCVESFIGFSQSVWVITDVTSGAGLPRGAAASSRHRITSSVVVAVTDLSAVPAVATRFAD